MPATTLQERATQIKKLLQSEYDGNRTRFDFTISQYISGDHNKELRRELMRLATGEIKPISKCGMHATGDALKNSFDQYVLF